MASTHPSHAGVSSAGAAPAQPAVDPAFVDRVALRLAAQLGPIARVLAKQAAARSFSREDFVRLCSEALDGDARAQFVRAALEAERAKDA